MQAHLLWDSETTHAANIFPISFSAISVLWLHFQYCISHISFFTFCTMRFTGGVVLNRPRCEARNRLLPTIQATVIWVVIRLTMTIGYTLSSLFAQKVLETKTLMSSTIRDICTAGREAFLQSKDAFGNDWSFLTIYQFRCSTSSQFFTPAPQFVPSCPPEQSYKGWWLKSPPYKMG